MTRPVIFWFRRDLRLHDNHGLFEALSSKAKVIPVFIFDTNILSKLEFKDDKRVTFIYDNVRQLQEKVREYGSELIIKYGVPWEIFEELCEQYNPSRVYTNRDYEPYARLRKPRVEEVLQQHEATLHSCKDHVIFEQEEILTKEGKPYTVFTPYSKSWKTRLSNNRLPRYPSQDHLSNLFPLPKSISPSLEDIGFTRNDFEIPSQIPDENILLHYKELRDFPARQGTTHLGIHLRFGTVSIRDIIELAKHYEPWLGELIWREFYIQVLWHFPHVAKGPFRKEYENIPWRNNEAEFKAWCEGKTGFPLVDAGMRELNRTGYMHNRVRMVVANFLTKDLLINWQWGERYFAQRLLDYELASNNGGWQWSAGTGTDAAPYFRIFNPISQQEKFDPDFEYIRMWIPEFGTEAYPKPIVDHKMARERCLEAYKVAREGLS